MRVTNKTLTDNYLRNLSKNLNQMQISQNQLSSGKEISKPSDDPVSVSRIMSLENSIAENEQYEKNISDALGWSFASDNAMGGLSDSLLRARELVVYGASSTLSQTDRAAIEDEMSMLVEQMAQILNANFDGRYIFGGQRTLEAPFLASDASGVMTLSYGGDSADMIREISEGVTVTLITDGSKITRATEANPGNEELGDLMSNILTALEDGDISLLSNQLLADVDAHLENVTRIRSKMGATSNRLEAALDRNGADNLRLSELISQVEDIDFAEKMMEYSTLSAVYEASLSAGARILQPSLLDYLR